MEDISRRSFLTGAVAVAGIAATAGLAGCAPQQTSEATAGSSAQAAPAGSGKTTIGQTPAWLGDAPQIQQKTWTGEVFIVETKEERPFGSPEELARILASLEQAA